MLNIHNTKRRKLKNNFKALVSALDTASNAMHNTDFKVGFNSIIANLSNAWPFKTKDKAINNLRTMISETAHKLNLPKTEGSHPVVLDITVLSADIADSLIEIINKNAYFANNNFTVWKEGDVLYVYKNTGKMRADSPEAVTTLLSLNIIAQQHIITNTIGKHWNNIEGVAKTSSSIPDDHELSEEEDIFYDADEELDTTDNAPEKNIEGVAKTSSSIPDDHELSEEEDIFYDADEELDTTDNAPEKNIEGVAKTSSSIPDDHELSEEEDIFYDAEKELGYEQTTDNAPEKNIEEIATEDLSQNLHELNDEFFKRDGDFQQNLYMAQGKQKTGDNFSMLKGAMASLGLQFVPKPCEKCHPTAAKMLYSTSSV